MVYLEYERLKKKYLKAQVIYDQILSEKEVLFIRTQPKGLDAEKEKVKGTPQGNVFDDYLILKEAKKIDSRLEEAKRLMDERSELLETKEEELRHSKHIYDQIYTLRHIDRKKVWQISRRVNYSEAQVYRIMRKINREIKDDSK